MRLVRKAEIRVRAGGACKSLAAADALLSSLAMPTTWRGKHVPRRLVRRPLVLLRRAGRSMLRDAGRKCAKATKSRHLRGHKGGSGFPVVPPPPEEPEQGGDLEAEEREGFGLRRGKFKPPKSIGSESGARADRFGVAAASRRATARIAADPISFFRIADVGVPPRQASPQEMTTAIAPNSGVAWYTGNSSVGLSTDNGRTWSSFNPSNVLPDSGMAFCCDQLVSYSPTYNLFVWVSQYWCTTGGCLRNDPSNPARMICRNDGAFNRVRIAVARPEDLRANATNPGAAWTYWDITPQALGQPSNAWFDRSDLSVNGWNMNWNVDVICGNTGIVLGRISLAQLAARGTVSLSFANERDRSAAAQGSSSPTTYFSGAGDLSSARIWSWAAFSGTLFRHDIPHATVPIFDNTANGTDGANWYGRYGIFPGQVETSTVSGNTIYLAQGTGRSYCTARCTTTTPTLRRAFDRPAVLVTRYDVNTWRLLGERWLWNSTFALTWPAMQTDGAGNVGIALRGGADTRNARPIAGYLTPDEEFTFALPEGGPHSTGDYYSLRPGRTSQSFVMTAQTVQNDAGAQRMHWNYVEYGRGAAPYVAPPDVRITAPTTLYTVAPGALVMYSASVSDPIDGTLPAAAIRWTMDGSPIGTGASFSRVESTPGTHRIVVTATNGDGRSASDSVTIRVNSPLSSILAAITAPLDGFDFGYSPYNPTFDEYCQDISFTATALGGAGPLTYIWTDSRDGAAPSEVATSLSPTITLCGGKYVNQTSTHDLTLTVFDGKDTAKAFVRVYVKSWKLG